jgi:hypothetical protein
VSIRDFAYTIQLQRHLEMTKIELIRYIIDEVMFLAPSADLSPSSISNQSPPGVALNTQCSRHGLVCHGSSTQRMLTFPAAVFEEEDPEDIIEHFDNVTVRVMEALKTHRANCIDIIYTEYPVQAARYGEGGCRRRRRQGGSILEELAW